MGGACSTYEDEKFLQGFDEKTMGMRTVVKI
jgi:hypothetical protein